MRSGRSIWLASLALTALLTAGAGAAPAVALRSGPQVGERPLPFTSNIVTGPYRGQQHCYICGLKEEPAVLVFARRTDENTGRLLRTVRDAVREHQSQKLFAWFVFLAEPSTAAQTEMESAAYRFAAENTASALPISVLGEPQGPPGYRIAPDAEVTVVLFRSGKVISNRAYRAKEWTSKAAEGALKDLPRLLAAPAGPPPSFQGR